MITVMAIEEIMVNIEAIKETIELITSYDSANVDGLCDYLQKLASIQPLGSDTQASAEWHMHKVMEEEVRAILKAEIFGTKDKKFIKVPPTVARQVVNGVAADYIFMYNRIKSYNSDITHTIDTVRTLISKSKEQMYLNRITN